MPNGTSRSLEGRVAIVTGSGRNIGRAIALALAEAGASVVLNGHRDRIALEQVAVEIRTKGGEAMIEIADVGDPAAVQSMVDRAVDRFGRLDIAVSNAAIRLHRPFLEITDEDWQMTLNTNLSAVFYLARAALPHMKSSGWGRVIHISSREAFRPNPNRAHNIACKAAVFALAKAIALEFGPFGITANSVAPGLIETARDAEHFPNFLSEQERRKNETIPVRRLGRPEDIAAVVRFLCQEDAGYINGQLIHANGGEHMF